MTWRESTYSSSACAIGNGRRNNASTSRNAATQLPILVQQPFHQTHHLPPPGGLLTKRHYARLHRTSLRSCSPSAPTHLRSTHTAPVAPAPDTASPGSGSAASDTCSSRVAIWYAGCGTH